MSTSSLFDSRVPIAGRTLGHFFAWLSVFLIGVMAFTGILLSTLYVPSTAPAVSDDGSPLGLTRVTAPFRWLDREYRPGMLLPLTLDPVADTLTVPPALAGRVAPYRHTHGGRVVRPSNAWLSVEHTIERNATLGWFVRGMHRGAAHLLMATLLLHLAVSLLARSYRRPRQWIWIGGLLMLVIAFAFVFSGSILPWSQQSFVASRIAAGFVQESLPFVGDAAAGIVRGAHSVGQSTLTRFASLHTTVLPLAALALLVLHLALVRIHGQSRPSGARRTNRAMFVTATVAGISTLALVIVPILAKGFDPWSPAFVFPLAALAASVGALAGIAFGPEQRTEHAHGIVTVSLRAHFYRDLLAWLLLAASLVTIVLVETRTLTHAGEPVDLTAAVTTPDVIRPEWYLRWASELVGAVPEPVALGMMVAVLLGLGSLPWWSREDRSGGRD